jgi:hypothetical protein
VGIGLLCFCGGLLGCRDGDKKLSEIDLGSLRYCGVAPAVYFHSGKIEGEFASSAQTLRDYSFQGYANMLYITAPGDSLQVTVLDFENDVFALGFYMNSGLFQEKIAVIKGDRLEQSMRAGHRLFIFRHSRLRRHDRGLLEKYVQMFPGYRAGLPQEFLSLPFKDREMGRTTIQTRYFHGVAIAFPMLVQSYSRDALYWNIARSWSSVSEEDWNSWVYQLQKAGKSIRFQQSEIVFDAGNGERAMATRLPGGRIVCVWGALDPKSLLGRYKEARQNIYDSRF